MNQERYPELRAALRDLFKRFPDEYFRKIDDARAYPEACVDALTRAGWLAVMIPQEYGGAGLGLAEASGAPIIGFNVRANASARNSAHQKGVEIRYYSIIYNLVDDVKAAASGLLSAEIKETFIGYAEILEVFQITKVGKVAGCRVTEGKGDVRQSVTLELQRGGLSWQTRRAAR